MHLMVTKIDSLIKRLQDYPDPIIRWKMSRNGLGEDSSSSKHAIVRKQLGSSPIIQRLLSNRDIHGRFPFHPYDKWFGAHWVLSILADLGYPEGDESLKPLLEQSSDWLLSNEHAQNIKTINGRVRRCASQEGNFIYYSLALGLADERTEELATRLIKWQWEDGGWN
jgi:hypothetical protein